MTEQALHESIYIDGRWVDPAGAGVIEIIDPATESVIGQIPASDAHDVDRAVRAASAALPEWASRPPAERVKYLGQIADSLRARRERLIDVIIHEVGCPRWLTERVQVDAAIRTLESMAEVIEEVLFEERIGESLVVRDPVGVVGAITPWNYPLLQIVAKVGPALAAGCTVVLKPSEVAPLNAYLLTEAIHEVALPPGVFNLVTGYGPVVGEAIASHPLVDMVSFTGSTTAGRRVSELAAARVKKTSLELGGKSPNVLLDDLDGEALERAVEAALRSAFPNSGQNCGALTRLLVPQSKLGEVERLAARAAEAISVGDPSDEATYLGPLVSHTQRERVRAYIQRGVEEGGRLITGGAEPPPNLSLGYYVQPTIFTDVTPQMTIAREEIFGPVLVILPYRDEDDAVRIANDSEYGLSAGVRSADPERAQRVARRIRTGQVLVNDGVRTVYTPFGGLKQSGHGRESGRYGVEEFLVPKALHL